jgi:hypothetical protein
VIWLALAVLQAAPLDPVGVRIAQSAESAERLQGPLDGAWILAGARGRILGRFQIGNPPASGGQISCAWRPPEGTPAPAGCRLRAGRLVLVFAGRQAVLRRERAGVWRGELTSGRAAQRVVFRRG